MAKKIDFSKWQAKTVLIALAIIVIVILFLLFLRLNFLVGEQLRMTVEPEYSELTATSPGVVTLGTDVKIYNRFVCQASCSYTLTDLSDDTLLDNGTFISKAFKNEKYSRQVQLDEKGYGTKLYLYRIECINEYNSLCPAVDDKLVRKSLFVVSYVPDESQTSALEYSRSQYAMALGNYINASRINIATGQIIGLMDLPLDTSQYHSIDNDLSSLDSDLAEVIKVWSDQDLLLTRSIIDSRNIVPKSDSILQKAKEYNSYVKSFALRHNILVSDLYSIYSKSISYSDIASMPAPSVLSMMPDADISSLNEFISDYNDLSFSILSEYNHSSANATYNDLYERSLHLDNLSANSISASINEMNMPLYVHSRILCMQEEALCINNDYSSYTADISNGLSDDLLAVENACNISAIVYSNSNILNSNILNASANSSNQSENQTANQSTDSLLLQYKLLLEYYSLTGNPAALFEMNNIDDELSAYSIPPQDHVNDTFDADAIYFHPSNNLIVNLRNIVDSCNDWKDASSQKAFVRPLAAKPYNLSIMDDPSIYDSQISFHPAPEFIPQCCLYGECQSCEKSPGNDPLIMLHGHSFVEDVHAYRSIEIFNSFEKKFSEDKLYFSSGVLVQSADSTQGILGRYYLPLASKPTYYLETYNDLLGLTVSESKTKNIDSYALRLKEHIDYTLYLTGAKKVDIVAHSMGGLAVRRYIQIFGDDKIDTVILIGTPNKGITERTYTFCKIFGEANECDDMRSGGLFLRKLNDISNTAITEKMYLVVGNGCDTDGFDGDGVVTSQNAAIDSIDEDNILYVQGKCSGTRMLHNDMLDTQLYPEVYWFVKEKLKG